MTVRKVGVVGCGLMGSGIAEAAARAGYDVLVREVSEELIGQGKQRIAQSMEKAIEREKMTSAERDLAVERLSYTTKVSELVDRDLIIEAVVEDLEVKRKLFVELDGLCPEHTIFASNTSSLAITDMAAAVKRPDRFLGLHFFNPVPVMKLVEVVRTIATSEKTVSEALDFARRLGKEAVAAKDQAGFIVNLLLVPYMLDAVRQLERGAASMEDLDKAMVLGCGYPMGPIAVIDFVGTDTALRIAEILYDEYREPKYAPPPLLRRIVAMGRYGRKVGRGFYDYSGEVPVPLPV
ncbi:MAG: 3-hydroxybutyryl-CoA dehydrogenase [Gemmatimonadetes bacterium]|nr:3-hydroxybutyryl-CoA dehydrogenase [Gemmatimonadota bacterium]